MKRSPLPVGAIVGPDNKYTIDRVIGLGANCVVYDAYYLDCLGNKKPVKLKECYPAVANVTRNENNLFWKEDSDKESAYARFEQSYQIASQMQNSDATKNTVVYSLDLFGHNNTKYVAMIPENGTSYDNDTSENIEEIIRTALALTNALGRYHQFGYLHLDVKPSNFIATPDHTGNGKNIALFDFDTLVPIDLINDRIIQSVSYSKGWAAPEQMQQQIGKLCPATDLFSVGSILFERIMKRQFENSDMSPLAKWEFDNRFDIKSVNPKVKRLLTDVFHKTLASNVKKRYQTADELSAALKELLDVVDGGKPFIISSFPVSTCHFVGRNVELEDLHTAVTETGKVFIFGCGGIGKSELAKRYISLYADTYDAIVFIRYAGSIAEALRSIVVNGVNNNNDELDAIEALCDSRVLLVLDNFDVASDEDVGLEHLLSLGCNLIITTRTDFSSAYPDIPYIKIGKMAQSEFRIIFESESSRTLDNEEFMELIPIIHLGEQCTLYIVLLARLLKSGDYSLKELCAKVSAGLSGLDDTEDILNTKDGIRIKQTVAKAMSELFKLTKLTPNQSEILLLLYHLDCLNLSKKQLKEIASIDNTVSVSKRINALNELIERGFIAHNVWGAIDALIISDVIKEVIDFDLNPSIIDSNVVKEFIEQEFFTSKEYISSIAYDDEIVQDKATYNFHCIFKIVVNSNLKNHSTREYFIDLLYRMLGGEESATAYIWNEYTQKIIRFLSVNSLDKAADCVTSVKANIVLLTIYCYYTRPYSDLEEDNQFKCMKIAEKSFFNALNVIEQNSLESASLIDDLCRPLAYCAVSSKSRCKLIDPHIIQRIFDLQPTCIDPNVTPFKSFGVRVFNNSNYEIFFLQQIKTLAKGMADETRKELVYKALGKIMLIGAQLPSVIDYRLGDLRKELFSICSDMFKNVEDINPLDFAPDPLNTPKYMTIGMGLECFKASFSTVMSEKYNSEKECSKSSLDFSRTDLIDFLENVQNIDSAEELYAAIERFRHFVDAASRNELSEEDKGFLSLASEKLNDKFGDSVIADDFPCYDGGISLVDAEDAEAMLHSIVAVIFCLLGDKIQVQSYLKKISEYSREYLYSIPDNAIINFENEFESDLCFWGTVNRLNQLSYANVVLPYLLDYANVVEELLSANIEYDESWMYSYYKKIVSTAITAKETLMPSSAEGRLIRAIFKDDDSEEGKALESYNDIIKEYTSKTERINDSKYHL